MPEMDRWQPKLSEEEKHNVLWLILITWANIAWMMVRTFHGVLVLSKITSG